MKQLNPKHLQAVMQVINRGPFFRHLSMRVTELGAGYSVVELKVQPGCVKSDRWLSA